MKKLILKGALSLFLMMGLIGEAHADAEGIAIGGFAGMAGYLAYSRATAPEAFCSHSATKTQACCGEASVSGFMTGGANAIGCIMYTANTEPGFAAKVTGALGSGWATMLAGAGAIMAGGKGEGIKNMCSKLETINKSLAVINGLNAAACGIQASKCVNTCTTSPGKSPVIAENNITMCEGLRLKSVGISLAKMGVNIAAASKANNCQKKSSSENTSVAQNEDSSDEGTSERDIHQGKANYKINYGYKRKGKLVKLQETDDILGGSSSHANFTSPKVQGYDKSFNGKGFDLPKLKANKVSNDESQDKREFNKKDKRSHFSQSSLAGGAQSLGGVREASSKKPKGMSFDLSKMLGQRKPANKKDKKKRPMVKNDQNGIQDVILGSDENVFEKIRERYQIVFADQ